MTDGMGFWYYSKTPCEKPTVWGWIKEKIKGGAKAAWKNREKILEKVKPKPKPSPPPPTPAPNPTTTTPPPTRPWKGAYSPTELWLVCPKPKYEEDPVYTHYCAGSVCEVGCSQERSKFVSSY